MFLPFLAALFLGGAAFAAWQLIKHVTSSLEENPNPSQQNDQNPSKGAGDEPATERQEFQARNDRDRLIDKVVAATTFATKQMVISMKTVGIEEHPSLTPADDVQIRPLQTISEISKSVPSTRIMDDEVFFALAAAKQLPVMEHVENVELKEAVYGKSRNVLLVLQDVSGSMNEHDRLPWSIRLCGRLIDKCSGQEAEFIIIPFEGVPHEKVAAKTEEERAILKEQLPLILRGGGGTDIDAVLQTGMDILESELFGEARIILVTDGTQSINLEDTAERLKTLGVLLHTICVAGEDHEQLRQISQRYDVLRDPE